MKSAKLNINNQSINIENAFELDSFDLYPSFEDTNLKSTADVKGRNFASLQLRVKNAIKALVLSNTSQIAIICGSNQVDKATIAKSICEKYTKEQKIHVCIDTNKKELFFDKKNNKKGIMYENSIVIMPCALLNTKSHYLDKIDKALYENKDLKLILCGDATDCAQLAMLWPTTENAISADFVVEFPILNGIYTMSTLIKSYVDEYKIKDVDIEAIKLLCTYTCRLSGDRRYLGLLDETLRSVIKEASFYTDNSDKFISKKSILKALCARDFRVNYLQESELREHRDRQLLITTEGAVVGQINGLSVIETMGTSYEFGEPVRITATIKAGGDGDVVDIERKAELAGQIHAKAMMIINGFITKEFGSESPLPVTSSLVFEQSYSEVDGDSASLTGLCAILSCLSNLPIRQDLAVTGAVDQFGDVQAVGGVNEKIEGFFRVCRLHGLTGTQGVIIPESCIHQLVLRPYIVKAVEKGLFHIYTVSHVKEAIKLLTTVDFGNAEIVDSMYHRIVTRLYEVGVQEDELSWWNILRFFKKD